MMPDSQRDRETDDRHPIERSTAVKQDERAPFVRALQRARVTAYAPGEFVEQESFMRAAEIRAMAAQAGIAPGVSDTVWLTRWARCTHRHWRSAHHPPALERLASARTSPQVHSRYGDGGADTTTGAGVAAFELASRSVCPSTARCRDVHVAQ